MDKRVYIVDEINGKGEPRLVEAATRAQAVGYVVRNRYSARAATVKDMRELRHIDVEDAGKDE